MKWADHFVGLVQFYVKSNTRQSVRQFLNYSVSAFWIEQNQTEIFQFSSVRQAKLNVHTLTLRIELFPTNTIVPSHDWCEIVFIWRCVKGTT